MLCPRTRPFLVGVLGFLVAVLAVTPAHADCVFDLSASFAGTGAIDLTGASGGLGQLASFSFVNNVTNINNQASGVTCVYAFGLSDVTSLSFVITGNTLTTLDLVTSPVSCASPLGCNADVQEEAASPRKLFGLNKPTARWYTPRLSRIHPQGV